MRSQSISEPTLSSTWLYDETAHAPSSASGGPWNEDLTQVFGGLMDIDAVGVVEKVNEDKLAHDVEDLSAIFAQLEDGNLDFALPSDAAPQSEDWIEELEQDAVNVEELSAAFDLLAEQVGAAPEESSSSEVDSEEEESEEEEEVDAGVRIVPAAPTWICGPPLDPRSVIRTPIFQHLDPRIPSVTIPRMDLACHPTSPPTSPVTSPRLRTSSSLQLSPKKDLSEQELHDPATCWICKSDKSAFRKFALHRYLEKRRRRNWKRGPRYSGRSHVATNRVREGGRFVCTAKWI